MCVCVCVRERESGVCVSCVCELCVGVFGSEVVVVCMCVKFGCVYACWMGVNVLVMCVR